MGSGLKSAVSLLVAVALSQSRIYVLAASGAGNRGPRASGISISASSCCNGEGLAGLDGREDGLHVLEARFEFLFARPMLEE